MKKRIISVLLLCCMVLGLLPTTTFANNGGAKAIQLGTSGISGYDSTNSSYDYIHFGTWNNSTVKWRVLDTKTNMANAQQGDGFFLLSDVLLGTGEYGGVEFDYTTPYTNDWKGSRGKDWCNDFYTRNFSTTEQKAVLATNKSDALYGMYYDASDNILDGDKVFFLSAEEAENAAYGFTDDNARIANYGDSAGVWWLRSPRRLTSDFAGTVNKNGAVIGEWVNQTNAARPAFNLKPDSVLIVSAAVGGKGTADGMFKIPEYSGDEWKLTLLDDTRTFRVTETTAAGKPGGTVTLNFSGPRTGLNEYISAIIEGENGAAYYGRIMKPTATDRQLSFTLPHDLASGNYKLHVFSEQCNGDYQTDYASQFQTVALTVEEAATEQFALTPGGTYYFDLSSENIPGTVNDDLPDKSMHYVPFTYAGAVDAYKLTSEMATTEEYAKKNKYLHSLFVADYAVTGAVNWNVLNGENLIFGKNYSFDGVDYMLRAPSVGSGSTGSGALERGTPQSNEWDRILDKNDGYIKNWSVEYSWGQDTSSTSPSHRGIRGNGSAHNWASNDTMHSMPSLRFRPVLEVLDPDTLGTDGLKAVTLDLGGGKLGGSSDRIQIIVKNGKSFTAPASDGLTRPDGNTGSYFKWLGSDGELYEPGDNVSADVTSLTAQFALIEQFRLAPGGTYYFDLSAMGIPGTVNDALPDNTMHYVPFTYVGIVEAYNLKSAMETTEAYAKQNAYVHSMFVADYAVTHTISWKELYAKDLIFGKGYVAGGVDYMLRMPSAGSGDTGSGNSKRGTPQSNEWDRILDKNDGYIKNWSGMSSWGQDTPNIANGNRALRGHDSIRNWGSSDSTISSPDIGFRPVLEVLNLGTLDADGLKAVTLDLGGGKLGGSSDRIQIIVKNGESFTAPASDGLTRPDGDTGSSFKWFGSDGKLYEPGDNVPADVTSLTAQFDEQFTLMTGGTYWFDLSGMGIPGTVNGSLPDTTLHYVPFTYAGTVDAYKLASAMAATEEYAQQNKYAHSLFVADYAVTHTISWENLNTAGMIFGKNYAAGSVEYTLRAPSEGRSYRDSGESICGNPQSNEWDRILDKYDGYIKNWNGMSSWGQDTAHNYAQGRATRGYSSARNWSFHESSDTKSHLGFRPVLEVLNPKTLGADGLKAITLDLGGGKLGGSSEDIQIIVKNGESFTAPASDGLTRPDGDTGSYFMWLGSDSKLYAPGSSVPANVNRLTAQFGLTEQFTLVPGGTYYFDLSGGNIPGRANGNLPDTTLHYVPFIYAGAVDAYKLTSAMETTEEYARQNQYTHSLFVAYYDVTHLISWNNLNTAGMIFGKNYAASGVDYTLRAPSAGSSGIGYPESNEWDRILAKDNGYIKNWEKMSSWGQDIASTSASNRVFRGRNSAYIWRNGDADTSSKTVGFRPILEVLNPDTLGSDGLKAVTLDLGGGKLGNSSEDIQIIVKNGSEFTAPASDGLTSPDGNTGSSLMWRDSDGKFYAPGDSVPANVNRLKAQFDLKQQFTLASGGTYYFDLSGMGIPGTINSSLPDTSLHYVPFTYAGTVDAYKLVSAMATTEEYAQQNKYPHSLFVADYAVTHTISWDNLNTAGLIFGKTYAADSVEYTLRAPSVGSDEIESGESERGTPQSNEWDKILDKYDGYIKNWSWKYSLGQDNLNDSEVFRALRGNFSVRFYSGTSATNSNDSTLGFRPVLEVLNPDTLGTDGLKAVTLDLGGGKLGGSQDTIQIIVKNGESFTAPASDGLTRPDGNTDSYFKWRGSDGKLYAPGDNVPADVDKLTALFDDSGSHTVTITTDALPDGKVGVAYSQTLAADGTAPITWSISGGALPDGLKLDENTGGISGEPTAEGTATFTVKAENSGGSDTKELSITITKDAPVEYTVTVTTEGNGTASASHAKAVAGTEITLTATPDTGYRFREWQVIDGGVTIKDDKFTMPDKSVEVKAVFEEDTPPMPTDPAKPGISVTGTYTYKGSEHTAAVTGYDSTTMDISGNTGTDAGDYTISVTSRTGKWADGSTEAVTAAWSISKATQEAPNGLAGVAPTTEGGSDGRITGVDATMEYRMAGDGSYTACGGTEIENLSAGNYFVRYAEDNNHFAGTDTEVTVGGGAPLADCTITFDGNGGSGSMEPITVKEGANYILPACGFTAPADQEFRVWEIGGTEYKVGDSYTVNVDTGIKALWENSVIPPTTYTVTISNDGNGSGTASPSAAVVGTEITLTATPNTGYRFKEWEIISGGVAITNNKFTMPDGNVEVKAIFEKDAPPAPTEYTVTVTSGGNGTASASHAKAVVGTEITLTATPNTGYRFKEWEVISGGVVITNNKFTMPDGNVEVRAIFAMISQQTAPDPVNENTGIPSQPENSGTASSANTDSGTNNGAGAAPASPFSATPGTEPAPGIKPGAENTRRTTPKDGILLREWQDKRDTTTITGDQPAADEEAEEGNNPFTDVFKDDWFYDDVMFVYENGLMEGISSTQFGPYETQTRGRMAEILWRMEGSPAPKVKNSFADVEDGARYADAIAWITENDILSGYSKDSFGPGDPITWEQLAVMFYRYAQYKGYDISIKGSQEELKDMDSTMDDAGKAVLWAVSNGLIREEADVLSALQDPVSRAEIAAMLHRFIDRYKLVQGMIPNGQMGWITPEEMNPSQTDRSRVPGWIGISLCAALTGGFVLFMLWLRHRRRIM